MGGPSPPINPILGGKSANFKYILERFVVEFWNFGYDIWGVGEDVWRQFCRHMCLAFFCPASACSALGYPALTCSAHALMGLIDDSRSELGIFFGELFPRFFGVNLMKWLLSWLIVCDGRGCGVSAVCCPWILRISLPHWWLTVLCRPKSVDHNLCTYSDACRGCYLGLLADQTWRKWDSLLVLEHVWYGKPLVYLVGAGWSCLGVSNQSRSSSYLVNTKTIDLVFCCRLWLLTLPHSWQF